MQTPSPKSLAECGLSLPKWYLTCILVNKEKLLELSRHIVADSYFAIFEFVDGLTKERFHIVSRFRSNAALMYLLEGEPAGKKGRPKKYDGKIDSNNLDMGKSVDICADEASFYTSIAYSKSLKRNVRLVVFHPCKGKPILYSSTDIKMSAKDVVEYYRASFAVAMESSLSGSAAARPGTFPNWISPLMSL